MIDLEYSLIIEATEEPDFFGFYSTDLEGFTGIGHSIEVCLYKAKWGMKEHLNLLQGERIANTRKTFRPKNNNSEWRKIDRGIALHKTFKRMNEVI